jgi:hypothetical protein
MRSDVPDSEQTEETAAPLEDRVKRGPKEARAIAKAMTPNVAR